jgi:hypothetical protein
MLFQKLRRLVSRRPRHPLLWGRPPLLLILHPSPSHATLQIGDLSYRIEGAGGSIEEIQKLRELQINSHRRVVLGNVAVNLAVLVDLLLTPDPELASVKKENEVLKLEVLEMKSKETQLAEEVSQMRISAEGERKKYDDQLAALRAELVDVRTANQKLDLELTSKFRECEAAIGERNEYERRWNHVSKRKAEIKLTLSEMGARVEDVERMSEEVEKLAFEKIAEAQLKLNQF